MTDLNRSSHVLFGLHTNTTTFSGTPSTMRSKELVANANILPRDRNRVERDLIRGDNDNYAALVGTKDLDPLTLPMLARGLSGNTGGAITSATACELADLFDSIFGAATDPAGAATTITGDTGSSGSLTVTSGTNVANGVGVLFEDGNGAYVAREVVSGGGTGTLTLDRDHTDGAPGSDDVLYRSAYWLVSPSTTMHTHAGIRVIGSNHERLYVGCVGTCQIEIREGEPVAVNTTWTPTDWSDAAVGTSFSAPTAGETIMGVNGALYVGESTKLILKNATIDFGYTIVPRSTINGSNGVHGYLVTRKQPVITGSFYFGSSGLSFGEVTDTEGSATDFDFNKLIALENATRTMMIRVPAAELRGRMADENGVAMVNFTAHARRPSSGSPCRVHLY
jgi:hypothetical protein